MASVRRRGDQIRVGLGREEAALLVTLASQVLALLRATDPLADDKAERQAPPSFEQLVADLTATPPTPQDPIMERLLPDGYRDDPEAAAEFRRLTDAELRSTKGRALQRLLDDVSTAGGLASGKTMRIDLDPDAAETWLHALNDVRLALGTQLDIREETESHRRTQSADDQEGGSLAVYDWLTWLQESIVRPLIED